MSAGRDSIQYWAGGSLLAHRRKPIRSSQSGELERSRGMWATGPWLSARRPGRFFYFCRWASERVLGMALWIVASLAALVISMRICWQIYGQEIARFAKLFSLVGYTFAPVPACLVAGQMGLFFCLGCFFSSLMKPAPFPGRRLADSPLCQAPPTLPVLGGAAVVDSLAEEICDCLWLCAGIGRRRRRRPGFRSAGFSRLS